MLAYDLQSQVSYSTFSLNQATGGNGGFGMNSLQELAGSALGGGLDNQGNLTLTGDSFLVNTAMGGGGSVGNGNSGDASGGGVCNDAKVYPTSSPLPSLTMVNDSLTENSAIGSGANQGNGGGLYNNAASAVVTQCTFRENMAIAGPGGVGFGGGIYNGNQGGILALTFSTVTFNSATTAYGGIYPGGTTTLQFDVISFNFALFSRTCKAAHTTKPFRDAGASAVLRKIAEGPGHRPLEWVRGVRMGKTESFVEELGERGWLARINGAGSSDGRFRQRSDVHGGSSFFGRKMNCHRFPPRPPD